MGISDRVRRDLIRYASSKRSRETDFSSDRPTEWKPQTVNNPSSPLGITFSDEAAWNLIVSHLESGHEVKSVALKQPPNRIGYSMLIELERDRPRLYVKLELGSGRVFGRSFHYSDYD